MSKTNSILVFQNDTLDILNVLDWKDLPEPVQEYVGRLRGAYSFFDDLYNFKWGLENFKPSTPKQKYYQSLFLGLIYYFLENEDKRNRGLALSSLNLAIEKTTKIIRDPAKQALIRRSLISIKHRLTKLNRILFLIDSQYDSEVKFRSIERHYKKFVKLIWVSKFSDRKFKEAISSYDQLFIFAHGDSSGTYLGEMKITPNALIKYLKNPQLSISILGLFSCQDNLSQVDVRNHVDYFITDSIISNPHINEMFSYGFIHNYLKSYRVLDSFLIGRFGPIFRATSNPEIQIFEGGSRIIP